MVVIVKVAVVEPAGIVTLAGTATSPLLVAESVTFQPPAGAAVVRVTVPTEPSPPFTVEGERLRPAMESTRRVSVADAWDSESAAVMVEVVC